MAFDYKDLKESLLSQGISFTEESNAIMANGYRIQFLNGEYWLASIFTNEVINKEPIYYTHEVVAAIGDSIEGTMRQQVMFVWSSGKNFFIRKKRFMEKHKLSMGRKYDQVSMLLTKEYTNKNNAGRESSKLEKRITANKIVALITKKKIPSKMVTVPESSGLFIDSKYTLPIPMDPAHMIEDRISVYDFVIIEFLISFPQLVGSFVRIAEGEEVHMYPYESERRMLSERITVPSNWKERILKSPYKIVIYKMCMELLSRGNNFEYLSTSNKHIWQQLSWLYCFSKREVNLLPRDFIEKIKGFSLTSLSS